MGGHHVSESADGTGIVIVAIAIAWSGVGTVGRTCPIVGAGRGVAIGAIGDGGSNRVMRGTVAIGIRPRG